MPFPAFVTKDGQEHEDDMQAQAFDMDWGQIMGGSGGKRHHAPADPGRLKGIIQALSSNRIENDIVPLGDGS